VCSRVATILGGKVLDEVHNHHNFAWREEHSGEMLWVCRKGATPAFPGQRGFVGGSMCEQSVILHGVENDLSAPSLYSTVHGAGRVMGRKQATGVIKKNKETGEVRVVREPLVTDAMMQDWVQKSGIELRGAGVDESPYCYKRLPEVLEQHSGMIEIEHTLTPIIVVMAGKHEFDPYKD
jgi:tRNA-splicing ligase RtcB